jgi:carbonic anhydrase
VIEDPLERFDRLVELNVIEQVRNLADTSIVQQSWHDEGAPVLHGWVYDIRTGLIKELVKMDKDSAVEDIYRYDFD